MSGLVQGYGTSSDAESDVEPKDSGFPVDGLPRTQPGPQMPSADEMVEDLDEELAEDLEFPDDFGGGLSEFGAERLRLRTITQPDVIPAVPKLNEHAEPPSADAKLARLLDLKRAGEGSSLHASLARNAEFNRPGFVNEQVRSILGKEFDIFSSATRDFTQLPKEGQIDQLLEAIAAKRRDRTKIDFVSKKG
jgi:hypothetical protein